MSLTKKQLDIMDRLPSNEDDYEESKLYDECTFCPKCGSKKMRSTDNMAAYPECWIKTFCGNCDFLIGLVDNSPYMGWWDFKYNNWVIDL